MKLLIALDESPVSRRAASVAAQLFASVPDTEYLVIDVGRVPTPWLGADSFGVVTPMDQRWMTTDDTDGNEHELVARAAAAGVDGEPIVRTGDPVVEICKAADDHDIDVIVVGSHDKTALARLLDPSVAAGVVRATYRPVLVVSGDPPAGTP